METWARVCYGIGAVALAGAGGAGFVAGRREGDRTLPRDGDLTAYWLLWGWRGGLLLGVGALLLGVVFRGSAAGAPNSFTGWLALSSVGGRAALMALVASLLEIGFQWRSLVGQAPEGGGWAASVPGAIMAAVAALAGTQSGQATAAPLLLVGTLVAAGLWLWSAGRALHALMGSGEGDPRAATLAFAGLTATVAVTGLANWRVWGTPDGQTTAFVGLLATWLVGVVRLTLQQKSARLADVLNLSAAILLVLIALSVRWSWPFA